MKTFLLKIVTPDSVALEKECTSLKILTHDGWRGILADHENAIFAVESGNIAVDGEEIFLPGGLLIFENNKAELLQL